MLWSLVGGYRHFRRTSCLKIDYDDDGDDDKGFYSSNTMHCFSIKV
jgi:hypothetical protein